MSDCTCLFSQDEPGLPPRYFAALAEADRAQCPVHAPTCAVLTLPNFTPCGKPAVIQKPPYACHEHAEALRKQGVRV